MLLRQLFDHTSYTYTYLVADEQAKKAILIDPVREQIDQYLQLLKDFDLALEYVADTHVHADHITASGTLRKETGAKTLVGKPDEVPCADSSLEDGQLIMLGSIDINAIYTPGHTDDSFCFYIQDQGLLFTGDTLFIRGTGRTDFQNGSASDLYDSLHQKLLLLPDETIVCPGHDYKGWTISTIGEEKQHNPRLQIKDKQAFIEHMGNLNLPDPKFMDVAVPANLSCGNT